MKELRSALLIFFALVASRMLSEGGGAYCADFGRACSAGLSLIIPFVLSVYFLDSLLEELSASDDKKSNMYTALFSLPYLYIVYLFATKFFTTLTLATIEHVFSSYFIPVLLSFGVIYWLNSKPNVRKVNKIFMITLIFSVFIFQFV